MGRVIKCAGCGSPIHIDEWGGLFTVPGLKGHFMIHNNVVCLTRWNENKLKLLSQIKPKGK